MRKTISALWNGDIEPMRDLGENNLEIKKIEELMDQNFKKITMSHQDDTVLFEEYADCVNEYVSLMTEQAFCDGFCLGSKIAAEALCCGDGVTATEE